MLALAAGLSADPAHSGHSSGGGISLDALLVVLATLAVAGYLGGVVTSRRRGRPWPLARLALWCGGIVAAAVSVAGPLARAAHDDFAAHMWAHLLGGMLAPLLLVLSAPVTLALRTLDVTPARRLSRLLRSAPARFVAHPVTAALLSAGGLWLLYLTPLFESMRTNPLMHVLVHAHLLLAGYLVTAAIVGIDPSPHRQPRVLVAVVLILSVASHSILAKHLYAHPPGSVSAVEAAAGAQLMYYVGGWVEAVVILLFCLDWYRSAGRRLDADQPGSPKSSGKVAAAQG